ncbi:AAA family ATPase [Actinospica sp.]|uniref:AAA family ATPase n=1 Tax=Actinospica sp. TaxID=1872142 RepID=UPI002C0DAB0A|nr:AAA family ATPase [Actinospica sp.]HWG25690.1 AAA family ATPase [Actinospica sp.]
MNTTELSGCVIVAGMPGAGKTTVSGQAARLLPRAARVKADDLNEMILRGFVWGLGEPREEALRHRELCDRNLAALASNFIDYGFPVFLDQLAVDRAELDFLVGLMAPRPVRLVTLAPSIAVCQQRNATRDPDESWQFDGYHQLEADLRRDFGDVGWWFDTSELTPEQTAEQLLSEVAQRAPIL